MKFLLATLLTIGSASAFSAEDFAKTKEMTTQHLDHKMADIQKAKDCVAAAKDEAGLKACHEEMKAKRKAHHEKMKHKKKEWKDKKKS